MKIRAWQSLMQKERLIVIGLLLALAAIAVFLIMPGIETLTATRQKLTNARAQLEQLKAYNEKIEKLNEKFNLNPEEIKNFLSILPKEQELAGLLIQLETLAAANELVMDSVNFKEIAKKNVAVPAISDDNQALVPEKSGVAGQSASFQASASAGGYKTLSVDLALSGGYQAFKNYLQSVEKNLRLMDVMSLDMAGGQSGGQKAVFSFSVNLNVYYQ
jgi:Tfp pilus assembly protein PilO